MRAESSLASHETLALVIQAGVARLTLNRPEVLNAINRRMAEEVADVVEALQAREDVRVLLLMGAGGNFCAGGDVKGMSEAGARSLEEANGAMAIYHRMTMALKGFDRPVVAVVDGVAYGAGFSLLLLADIVLFGERARLSMVFGRVGLIPDCGALYTLPRAVGLQRAKELVFSTREIGAEEAKSLGIGMDVWPSDVLLERAEALAASLGRSSPLALHVAKQTLDESLSSDFEHMLAREAAGQAAALVSPYHAEAVRRFANKKHAHRGSPPGS